MKERNGLPKPKTAHFIPPDDIHLKLADRLPPEQAQHRNVKSYKKGAPTGTPHSIFPCPSAKDTKHINR